MHLTFVGIHPPASLEAQKRLMSTLGMWMASSADATSWVGTAAACCRARLVWCRHAAQFAGYLPGRDELHQPDYTFRRLSQELGGRSVFSRICRPVSTWRPPCGGGRVGGPADMYSPSDHRAMYAVFFLRLRRAATPRVHPSSSLESLRPRRMSPTRSSATLRFLGRRAGARRRFGPEFSWGRALLPEL